MEKKELASKKQGIQPSSQFFERLKIRAEEKKKLVSNFEYISWLEEFTLRYESFTDDSWLYKGEELSETDKANVDKINILFEAVSDYCHKYYIDTTGKERFESERVYVKHNGVVYQIGLVVGQGAYVYVTRQEPTDVAIEFSDVVNDKKPADFDAKDEQVKKLAQIVADMKALNVPISIILETVNK